jgi:hypothetical protein
VTIFLHILITRPVVTGESKPVIRRRRGPGCCLDVSFVLTAVATTPRLASPIAITKTSDLTDIFPALRSAAKAGDRSPQSKPSIYFFYVHLRDSCFNKGA